MNEYIIQDEISLMEKGTETNRYFQGPICRYELFYIRNRTIFLWLINYIHTVLPITKPQIQPVNY